MDQYPTFTARQVERSQDPCILAFSRAPKYNSYSPMAMYQPMPQQPYDSHWTNAYGYSQMTQQPYDSDWTNAYGYSQMTQQPYDSDWTNAYGYSQMTQQPYDSDWTNAHGYSQMTQQMHNNGLRNNETRGVYDNIHATHSSTHLDESNKLLPKCWNWENCHGIITSGFRGAQKISWCNDCYKLCKSRVFYIKKCEKPGDNHICKCGTRVCDVCIVLESMEKKQPEDECTSVVHECARRSKKHQNCCMQTDVFVKQDTQTEADAEIEDNENCFGVSEESSEDQIISD